MQQEPRYAELRTALDQAWDSERPHVERMTVAAAVISEALQHAGMRPTLVGGGAVEFYAPGAYITHDLDFVGEGKPLDAIASVMRALGFERSGRHWIRNTLYVEVPSLHLDDPADEYSVGPFRLRVIRKEYILGERIVGFRHWQAWAHAQQAIDMIAALCGDLDEAELRQYLRREGAEHAYELLLDFPRSDTPITSETLDTL